MPQLFQQWDRVRSSFWFVPSIMVSGTVMFTFVSLAIDEAVADRLLHGWGWIYTGSAEGASTILGTVAGSMITVAGLVFSLTLVALTLASSQFGPRLLRNFMRDTTNQVVIGTFISTFMYCLLVLRSIRRENVGLFVPHLSVTLAVLLALVSLVLLIYFIHHVAMSIQADEVIARVYDELIQGIDRMFPEHIGRSSPRNAAGPSDTRLPETFAREARPVVADKDGYLQLIDPEALLKLAEKEDLLLRVEMRPGHYIIMGNPLLWAWPGDRIDERIVAKVNAAFVMGSYRNPVQDIEFSINQLVEIAVRALSPGMNDPFTPITCLDRLGSALCRLAQREMPSPYRHDEQNRLRVVAPPVTFPAIVNTSFNHIRQSARTNAVVTIRLMETIIQIAGLANRQEDRTELLRYTEMIALGAREALPEDEDRRAVEELCKTAGRILRHQGTTRH